MLGIGEESLERDALKEQVGEKVSMRDMSVTDAEMCEVDFTTAMIVVRRRPGEWQGFNLSEFIGRSLILPTGGPVVSNMFAYNEGEI